MVTRELAGSLRDVAKLFAVGHVTKLRVTMNEVTCHRNSHRTVVIPKSTNTHVSLNDEFFTLFEKSILPQLKFPFSRVFYTTG